MKCSLEVFALAALLLGACAGEDATVPLNGSLATGGNGGDATKPGTEPAKGTTDPKHPGSEATPGCDPPPVTDPGKCTTEETKEGTCKVCVDANGKETGRFCATPGDPANDLKCFEEKGKDGASCKVCVDASGKEVARGCSGAPPTDPIPAVKCEQVEAGGAVCEICYDEHGAVVSKACKAP